jgi:hypothetical protein
MGVRLIRGTVLIGAVVSHAVQAIGRAEMDPLVDHLDGAAARSAARRMGAILARQVPFADTLEEEKSCTQASLLEAFRSPRWRAESLAAAQSTNFQPSLTETTHVAMIGKRTVMENYTRYMDALITNARQPYTARVAPSRLPNDPFSQLLGQDLGRSRFVATRAEALNALLAMRLALRAYRMERGRYPASLSELAPAYLSRIPDDPFALQGPPRYRRTGDRYVLYSVGPDGVDDGGQPIVRVAAPGAAGARTRPLYSVEEGSWGDIVAGVHR